MDDSWNTRSSSSYANTVLFQGRPLDTETGLYDFRNRMYHPTLGRWLQQDPMGYGDGMGLYEFEGSWPTGATDPAGLEWNVYRIGEEKAFAEGEPGDTIAGLARIIHLNPAEAERWIDPERSADYRIQGNNDCWYVIPNTVLMVWMGECGGLGKRWVGWGQDRQQMASQGYHVEEWDLMDFCALEKVPWPNPGMPDSLQWRWASRPKPTEKAVRDNLLGRVSALSSEKALYGWYSWSHGNEELLGGPHMLYANTFVVTYSQIADRLSYGLAFAIVHACESAAGAESFLLRNPQGHSVGRRGSEVPWPRGLLPKRRTLPWANGR